MFRVAGVLAGASIILSGCTGSLPGLRPLTYATPGEARLYVLGSDCPHKRPGDEVGVLLAGVFAQAASQILKNFGQALKDGAQGGALSQVTASQNIQLMPGTYPKCVILVRGTFSSAAASSPGNDVTTFLPGLDTNSTSKIQAVGIPNLVSLDYYTELQLSGSSSKQALKFEPIYLLVARSIDGDRRGSRDVSISLKFSKVGTQDPVGSAVVVANRQIGEGWTYDYRDRRFVIESPWFGAFNAVTPPIAGNAPVTSSPALAAPGRSKATKPPASGAAGNQFAGRVLGRGLSGPGLPGSLGQATPTTATPSPIDAPPSAIVDMNSTIESSVPITVIATMVETRPTKQGLAFVAAIFNGVEPQVENAIKPLYDSAAVTQQTTTDLTTQATLAEAEGKARSSLITYCTASSVDDTNAGRQDRISKSADARSAQIKANAAALSASRPLLFPNVVSISEGPPSSINALACGI